MSYKLSKMDIAPHGVYGIEKMQMFKNTETKPTQSSMNFVQVALRLYNKYSVLFGIRDGFPEEVTWW